MEIITDPTISSILETYPEGIIARFQEFRWLVMETSKIIPDLKWLEESVKWSQISYRSNIGSPFRFGWSPKSKDEFGIYFVCTTTLIETFKKLYPDFFHFDGNRGLIFKTDEFFPTEPFTHCISLALRYKIVRDLPLLGA